jgi:hypothetical protein
LREFRRWFINEKIAQRLTNGRRVRAQTVNSTTRSGARDCRTSYGSIGSQIGLTSKSVKARVKKMVRNGIIEKFIVRVNPVAFGYRTAIVPIRTSNGITKDDIVQCVNVMSKNH